MRAMLSIDLQGRQALVTGGTGELGRAICRVLRGCGAEVAFTYLRAAESAERLGEELGATAIQCNITDFEAVKAIPAHLGKEVDVVIANAVIQYNWTTILDQPLEDFDGQYQSCARQLVHLAKVFAPGMKAIGGGRFVVINTECAIQSGAGMGAYASAKRGLDGIARVLAKELGPDDITVNQIAPGWMASDRIRGQENDVQAEYREGVPLRRTGHEREIAHLAAYLASDLGGFITGAFIPVNGGNAMVSI